MSEQRETFLDTIQIQHEDVEERVKLRNSTTFVNIWEKDPPASCCVYEDDGYEKEKQKRKKDKKHKKDKKDKKEKKKDKKRKHKTYEDESKLTRSKVPKSRDNDSRGDFKDVDNHEITQLQSLATKVGLSKGYKEGMLPGEADAMAQFVESKKRIPRRGEIGFSAHEIKKLEDTGYVMSGSRHKRMNAVRIRKESQIYSAEEKRILEQLNYEEKARRQEKIVEEFRAILIEKSRSKK